MGPSKPAMDKLSLSRMSADFYRMIGLFLFLFMALGYGQSQVNIITYTMTEGNDPDYIVGNVVISYKLNEKHTDDILDTLEFSFHALSSSEYASYFSIDGGILKAVQTIDRDDICANELTCSIPLDIVVGPSKYYEYIKVSVIVTDINDNTPVFESDSITRTVSESSKVGAVIPLDKATDPDSPQFGVKNYVLEEASSTFRLEVNDIQTGLTPQLVLLETLDREVKDAYKVVMIAFDGGSPPNSGSVVIDILVTDVNDNPPQFDNRTYEVSIVENFSPFSTIISLTATDADTGDNSRLKYSFAANTERDFGEVFGIDESNGGLYLKKTIDYEDGPSYTLDIIASDMSDNPLQGYAQVIVNIQDINDHAPQISVDTANQEGIVGILESTGVGDFVAQITVVDQDAGQNGQFECQLVSNSNLFSLTQLFDTVFKITSLTTFDRELLDTYIIDFVCQDRGSSSLSSTEYITIKVLDENDHPPIFMENNVQRDSFEAAIQENLPSGTFVYQVTAIDDDIGVNADIRYEIENPESKAMFSIDPFTGNITTRYMLDHERTPTVEIKVVAYDQGSPVLSSTCTVYVTVIDIDDNAPQFERSNFVFGIEENRQPNTYINQTVATDPDSEPFNHFTFEFDPRYNEDNAFYIEQQTGKIYTRKSLDREKGSVHHLVVTARSVTTPELSNTTSVFISVIDVNDNAPEILYPNPMNNTVHIAGDLIINSVIAKIVARDNDSVFGKLKYNITSGNSDDLFFIDQETGAVLVKRSLLSEDFRALALNITVFDNGTPPLTNFATLNVLINQSAVPFHSGTGDSKMISNQNLTIVISIACVSGILMVILIVAIALILRKQRQTPNNANKKYNYMPHIVEQNLVSNSRNNKANGVASGLDTSNLQISDKTKDMDDSIEKNPPSQIADNSFDPSQLYATVQKRTNSNASNQATAAPPRPSVYGNNLDPSRQWSSPRENAQVRLIFQDKDSDSSSSGEVSNADSGRGSNDDGQDPMRTTSPSVGHGMSSPPSSPTKSDDDTPPPIPTKKLTAGIHRATPAQSSYRNPQQAHGPPPNLPGFYSQPASRRTSNSSEYHDAMKNRLGAHQNPRYNSQNPKRLSDYELPERNWAAPPRSAEALDKYSQSSYQKLRPPPPKQQKDVNLNGNGGLYLGSHV